MQTIVKFAIAYFMWYLFTSSQNNILSFFFDERDTFVDQ